MRGEMKIAKMERVILPKQKGTHNAIDIKKQGQQQDHIAHGRNTLQQGPDKQLKFGEECDHPQYAEDPGNSKDRHKMDIPHWKKTNSHNDEIKYIPGIPEIIKRFLPM